MEDITDADYTHTKRVCKDFEMKKLGEYHDLYVQIDTLLLAEEFEGILVLKYMNCTLLILFTAPGWASHGASKKTKTKLRFINWVIILLR